MENALYKLITISITITILIQTSISREQHTDELAHEVCAGNSVVLTQRFEWERKLFCSGKFQTLPHNSLYYFQFTLELFSRTAKLVNLSLYTRDHCKLNVFVDCIVFH